MVIPSFVMKLSFKFDERPFRFAFERVAKNQQPAMIEDKYIGLALAVSSSLAIGTSFIITKKVRARLLDRKQVSDCQIT